MIQLLRARGRVDTDTVERALFIGAAGTLVLNVVTIALNFALAIVLTRLLGATGYGAYAFALAWAMVLAVPATLGLSALVVRSVAAYVVDTEWSLLRGVLRRANQLAAASSLVVVLLAGGVALLALEDSGDLRGPFLVGLLLVPLLALTTVRQSALQGLGRVVLARVPETLIVPLASLLLVASAYLMLDGLTATWAMSLGVSATALGLVIGAVVLRRTLPAHVRRVSPAYEMHVWGPSTIRLLAASLLTALSAQLGIILLGLMGDSADAGVFSIAQRLAVFASFLSIAASYPLMPAVTRLHTTGSRGELERVLSRSAFFVLLGSTPILIALIVLGGPITDLFGGDFGTGVRAMQILVLGELSGLVAGYAGLALIMTGNEREFMLVIGTRLMTALVAMAILIPLYGITGAAVGATIAAVLSNALAVWLAWRRLGIFTPTVPRFP